MFTSHNVLCFKVYCKLNDYGKPEKCNLKKCFFKHPPCFQTNCRDSLCVHICDLESGSGKSTLINALRGVDNTDEAAAPTGYVECTKEVNEYPYPEFPNITISDLPGVGTSTFKASDYLNDVGFAKFDFFIIVSNNRFKENDGLLAAEIQKMNKKFYFVRSKIDDTINAAKRTRKGFEEEKTLKEIKENCIAGNTRVFVCFCLYLISILLF
uniref:IRG-type G domain-containing protein n=1 Tax=Neogobius melanostomus TaxID=47308 RepID=A0A8C6UH87_9GOBI